MPHWNWKHHPEGTTEEEFEAILGLRRKTIREAAEDPSVAYPEKISDRWGYSTRWRTLGRDLDGSLKIVCVIQGPRAEIVYVRQYRLVKRQPLPYELGRRLREE